MKKSDKTKTASKKTASLLKNLTAEDLGTVTGGGCRTCGIAASFASQTVA